MAHAECSDNSVVLSPTHTIKNCCELAETLRERLSCGTSVTVDAAAVVEGDITLIQVLVAARKSATANGCDFTVANPSPAFVALVRQSGVAVM